ncbi:MAG: HEAT repeat domain-containing protein [Alphaproteobacteria bacterium]
MSRRRLPMALLVAALGALGPAMATELGSPDLGALARARTVRIVVDQAYGYRDRGSMRLDPIEGLELPYAELAADLLFGVGVRPVGATAEGYDATLAIEATGEALGTLYFDNEARFLFTGAQVRGSLSLATVAGAPYRLAFVGQIQRQRRIERDLGYEDPRNAPFPGAIEAPGSFIDRIVELVGAVYGAEALAAALIDGDARLRPTAARVLGDLGDAKAVPALLDALTDGDGQVRWQAAWSLGRVGDDGAIEPLIEALGDRDGDVRWFAAWSLAEITGQSFGEDQDAWQAWWSERVGQ